ncbi:PREDICTED: probable serine/threonine-protein kinase DDB_G0276461 isoform X2 [Polistes dominula]|uniref:Probable serine/threonine-protein kinase DDB_G0276461 isoform X2 n=1 Tax=Polistes dominula TaxID=743375 RepID=A0ABM1J3N2_POLDO|nr:PREDICTED: probable serine/threonine-protein kinase DDB_G0276461 isoform X2 [Polistes dominula]
MSLLSSSIGSIRCLADEEADNNMLQDLQLAAELGKTLLERNKELENIIKIHQSTIEEQAQEIEYMKKQTAALREVNDSRLKIYEQLEVSIQDLERANHRLVVENTGDKKLIKNQCLTIENLETRCEELQKKIDDLTSQREVLLRQQTNNLNPDVVQTQSVSWKASVTPGGSIKQCAAPSSPKVFQETINDTNSQQPLTLNSNEEELTDLLIQLQEARSQRVREQKKVNELGQQLTTLLQENSSLEEQLTFWRSKAQDVKNLQDEINTLEEVRRGQLCGRCLRGMDTRNHDELSVLDGEEYDDISLAGSLINEQQPDPEPTVQETCDKKTEVMNEAVVVVNNSNSNNNNPYRELVEKYQALLEVQRLSAPRRKNSLPPPMMGGGVMSLQEELEMSGEYNCFQNPSVVDDNDLQQQEVVEMKSSLIGNSNNTINNGISNGSIVGSSTSNGGNTNSSNGKPGKGDNNNKKTFSATPTDFSEAETSSSGFADETSNKATQTDGRPGSFLCSIADGEDCKFSIYDDNSPFESRFRKTPEYRQIFSEIFGVLKRAAEAKDEGEKLPLLDDQTNNTSSSNNGSNNVGNNGQIIYNVNKDNLNDSIISIGQDDQPSETTDDNQSVMSSVISSVVSEPPYKMQQTPLSSKESTLKKETPKNDHSQTDIVKVNDKVSLETTRHATKLDYISVNVHVKKSRSSSAKKNAARKLTLNNHERPTTPNVVSTTNPTFVQTKSNSGGRRRFRALKPAEQDGSTTNVWNNTSTYNHHLKTRESPNPIRKSQIFVNRNITEQHSHHSYEYSEYKPSTASEEVAKLKRLELSYAEVLRMPNKSKGNHHRS